uniref:Uncharacterized protein n=1 Tax=Ursus americanus TaxID=9643 RepID=A0A452RDW4_URSAM
MRRSAAPSQLQGNPFKKLKFIPPGRSIPSPDEENTKMSPDVKLFERLLKRKILWMKLAKYVRKTNTV